MNNYPRKYRNQKIEIDNTLFDSKAEAQMYLTLKQLQKAKKIKDLTLQQHFPILASFRLGDGTLQRAVGYYSDFTFFDIEQKRFRVIDCKGYKTEVYKLKKKLFNHFYKDRGWYLEEKI